MGETRQPPDRIIRSICPGKQRRRAGWRVRRDVTTEGPLSPEATQLYSLDLPIETKVRIIATKLYGAKDVVFLEKAQDQMREYVHNGWDKLAICMAKTPLSLTDNPKILGRPRDFVITVREFKPSVGAGFLVALTGEVMTMPGLPKLGAYENMDVIDGKIVGLF